MRKSIAVLCPEVIKPYLDQSLSSLEVTTCFFQNIQELNDNLNRPLDGLLFVAHKSKELEELIKKFHALSLPIMTTGSTAIYTASVLSDSSPSIAVPIGNLSPETHIEYTETPAEEFVTDRLNKLITTSVDLSNFSDRQACKGFEGAFKEFIEMS